VIVLYPECCVNLHGIAGVEMPERVLDIVIALTPRPRTFSFALWLCVLACEWCDISAGRSCLAVNGSERGREAKREIQLSFRCHCVACWHKIAMSGLCKQESSYDERLLVFTLLLSCGLGVIFIIPWQSIVSCEQHILILC
jgi:hypothetical protein